MRNAGLEETQAGIKIAGRNNNNHRYADDTALMAESEEELKGLLMKVEEVLAPAEAALLWTVLKAHRADNCLPLPFSTPIRNAKLNIQKRRSWPLVPSLHRK